MSGSGVRKTGKKIILHTFYIQMTPSWTGPSISSEQFVNEFSKKVRISGNQYC